MQERQINFGLSILHDSRAFPACIWLFSAIFSDMSLSASTTLASRFDPSCNRVSPRTMVNRSLSPSVSMLRCNTTKASRLRSIDMHCAAPGDHASIPSALLSAMASAARAPTTKPEPPYGLNVASRVCRWFESVLKVLLGLSRAETKLRHYPSALVVVYVVFCCHREFLQLYRHCFH